MAAKKKAADKDDDEKVNKETQQVIDECEQELKEKEEKLNAKIKEVNSMAYKTKTGEAINF